MKRRRAKNKAKKVVDKSNTDNETNSTVKKNRKSSLNRTSEDENVKLDTTNTNENIDKSIKLTSDDSGGTRINSISGSKTTKTVKKVTQSNDQYSNESFSNEDTTSSSISTNSNEINVAKSGNDSQKANYLFIELKLISIDAKCIDYMPLEQRFLCINSANSLTSHIEKFIINKMKLNNQLFDIVLIYNGYEIGSECPLAYLKNKFFKDKELMILYYAIIEKKLQMPSSSLSSNTTPSSSSSSTKSNSNEMDTD